MTFSDTVSGINHDILSDKNPNIPNLLSDIDSDTLSDTDSDILPDIHSAVLSDIHSDMYPILTLYLT